MKLRSPGVKSRGSHRGGWSPLSNLATMVIGGLITSTALTLFVLPTLYAWVERRRVQGSRFRVQGSVRDRPKPGL